jgi:hypothetical protein
MPDRTTPRRPVAAAGSRAEQRGPGRGRSGASGPLKALVAAALVVSCGGSASKAPGPSATRVPSGAPSPTEQASVGACQSFDLAATVVRWEAVGGDRVAYVELTVTGPTCTVPALAQAQLVERRGTAIIEGTSPADPGSLTVERGARLATYVQVDNYCGPAPIAPVTVAFVLGDTGRIIALPVASDDTAGVPVCLETEGSPGRIQMQPWVASTAIGSPPAASLSSANPAILPTPAAACVPTDQDAYVWGPSRLAVEAACVRITGTVADVHAEGDGDLHILVRLDPASRWLLTPANQDPEVLGNLVVEPVCAVSALREDVADLCESNPNPLRPPFPAVGRDVWMEGRYVLDRQHDDWAELHPLYRWGYR